MIDQLAQTIQALMESDGAANVRGELQTMLDLSAEIRAQHGQHVAGLEAAHEQQMAAVREEAAQAEASLRAEYDGQAAKVDELYATIEAATASYRQAVLAANPDVPPELVAGHSIAEIDQSLTKARQIVQQVQQQAIPAGAPPRGNVDASQMTAKQKIQAGLGG